MRLRVFSPDETNSGVHVDSSQGMWACGVCSCRKPLDPGAVKGGTCRVVPRRTERGQTLGSSFRFGPLRSQGSERDADQHANVDPRVGFV